MNEAKSLAWQPLDRQNLWVASSKLYFSEAEGVSAPSALFFIGSPRHLAKWPFRISENAYLLRRK